VEDPRSTLLVVEDDPDVADMLNTYFHAQGYDVLTVNWGEDALSVCRTHRPDLIILDIRLPDIDGYEVARRLRSNRRTDDIPIIFLTEKRNRSDRLQGLQLGADDYITKPFDFQELRLRVRNALRRFSEGPLNNPVTNLPEGVLVDERLRECLKAEGWAAVSIALENLEGFRESYGFVASDDVLRAVGLMIQNAVRDLGSANDFVGQLSDVEFLLVTTHDHIEGIVERIRTRLDQSLDYFYPVKDRDEVGLANKRLAVRFQRLEASQGPYQNIEELKAILAARKP